MTSGLGGRRARLLGVLGHLLRVVFGAGCGGFIGQ